MKTKKLICIMCPKGCNLTISQNQNQINVTGNSCQRGKIYAIDEISNPSRIVTSLVQTKYGIISVKTDKTIAKDKILDTLKLIKNLSPKKVKIGDVLASNILDTNVNIIVTRNPIK